MTQKDHETRVQRLMERRSFDSEAALRDAAAQTHVLREFETFADDEQCSKETDFIAGFKERLPELTALLAEMNRDYEDGIYRFYHGSFKVDFLQYLTEHAVEIVLALAPNPALDLAIRGDHVGGHRQRVLWK